jgi:hypothetical protein
MTDNKTNLTVVKNKIPEKTKNFLNNLSNYLQTQFYFYGSVQRYDYFPNHSDVDLDIFTNNEKSIINKLSNYLQINKKEIKKIVWKTPDNKMIYGYKYYYKNEELNIMVEFSIYNEKYKIEVLKSHEYKTDLPFYIILLLFLLKFLYYKLNFIDKKCYRDYKKYILDDLINYNNNIFVTI